MTRSTNVIRNTLWGIINKITLIILPFIVRTIIIFTLGNEYVGLNSLFTTVFTVLNLAEAGFSSAIVYSMYEPVAQKDSNRLSALTAFFKKVYLIVGSCILVVGIILLPFLKYIVKSDCPEDVNMYVLYFIHLFNTVITYFLYGYRASLFNAHQRIDVYTKILTVSALFQYSFQIIGLLIAKNYYVYCIAQSVVMIPQCLVVNYISKKMYPEITASGSISPMERKDITSRVSALLGHKIGGTFILSVDNIVISYALGLGVLGRYSNYFLFVSAIATITSMFLQGSLASIGNMIALNEQSKIKDLFLNMTFVWNWIVSFCSICFLCLFQDAITLWIGESNTFPFYFVVVISLYYYAWQFRAMAVNFKDAAGLWREDWLKPYLGMTINFVASLVLVIFFKDVVWVLIPTIIVMFFVYYPIETRVITNKLISIQLTEYIPKTALRFLITVVVGIITLLLCSFVKTNLLFGIIIKIIICLVVPNILFVVIYKKTPEFSYAVLLTNRFLNNLYKER